MNPSNMMVIMKLSNTNETRIVNEKKMMGAKTWLASSRAL